MEKFKDKGIIAYIIFFVAVTITLFLIIPIENQNIIEEKYGKLGKMAKTDERAKYVVEHYSEYPDDLIYMYYSNDRYFDMLYNYAFHKDDYDTMAFTAEELNSELPPRLYMHDYRWAYEKIGGGYIFVDGCMTVALTMADIGLFHDGNMDPRKVAEIAELYGQLGQWGGISEVGIENIFDAMGMKHETHFYDIANGEPACDDPSVIKNILDNDGVVMLGMFGETFGGHALLAVDYNDEGFIINDPASAERSEKIWTFEELAPEICYVWGLFAE
ncbi:MAG: hypothetical protein IJZ61_08845 [Oscillospiraceae bacterium]|nr:hypothetical protein [Oscillospiraceae bacterium]